MAVHRCRSPGRFLALTMMLILGAGQVRRPMYTVTNLGPREAFALNNLGDVVGNNVGISSFRNDGTPYIWSYMGPRRS